MESLFLGLVTLEEAKQGIGHSVCLVLVMINLKIVPKKLLGLSDLLRGQVFGIYKSIEIVVVSKNKNLILATF